MLSIIFPLLTKDYKEAAREAIKFSPSGTNSEYVATAFPREHGKIPIVFSELTCDLRVSEDSRQNARLVRNFSVVISRNYGYTVYCYYQQSRNNISYIFVVLSINWLFNLQTNLHVQLASLRYSVISAFFCPNGIPSAKCGHSSFDIKQISRSTS